MREGFVIRTIVKLGIGKEPNEVHPIAGRNVIALQMQGNVSKCHRVAINVQSLEGAGVLAVLLGFDELAAEILGEIRRS